MASHFTIVERDEEPTILSIPEISAIPRNFGPRITSSHRPRTVDDPDRSALGKVAKTMVEGGPLAASNLNMGLPKSQVQYGRRVDASWSLRSVDSSIFGKRPTSRSSCGHTPPSTQSGRHRGPRGKQERLCSSVHIVALTPQSAPS